MVMHAAFDVAHPTHWVKERALSLRPRLEQLTSSSAPPWKPVIELILTSRICTSGIDKFTFLPI
jgi:hypothetical protein